MKCGHMRNAVGKDKEEGRRACGKGVGISSVDIWEDGCG